MQLLQGIRCLTVTISFVCHQKPHKVCLNSKFPPTLSSTLEIQPATPFGEKCVRLYLLGYLSISVFTTQNFRIKEKNENLFLNATSK
jgi:hypothetical protein